MANINTVDKFKIIPCRSEKYTFLPDSTNPAKKYIH